MGSYLNANWNQELAKDRIDQLGLDPRQKAGSLSGGQRAQLALTMAIAKRPALLLLDEPWPAWTRWPGASSSRGLMEIVAEHAVSVFLSSHLVADLERVCDYLVLLVASHVQLSGEVTALLATHQRLSGPRRDPRILALETKRVIEESHTASRPRSSCARTSRFSIRHGPSSRSRWTSWCLPTWAEHVTRSPGRRSGLGVLPMIRFAWLQFRMQAAVAAGALAIVAVVLALTGPHLVHLYDTTVAGCAVHHDCSDGHDRLHRHRRPVAEFPGLSPARRALAHRASSGARRSLPGNSRPGPSAWRGPRVSPVPAGWR